jgi:hypothetical protein
MLEKATGGKEKGPGDMGNLQTHEKRKYLQIRFPQMAFLVGYIPHWSSFGNTYP